MDYPTFTAALDLIGSAYGRLNYSEWCELAGFREDSYSEDKWRDWGRMVRILGTFDNRTLSRIVGVEVPAAT